MEKTSLNLSEKSGKFSFIVFLIVSLFFWQCTSDKKIDSKTVKKEIETRKARKVTEAEILEKVLEIGNTIADASRQTLGKNLQEALVQGGVEHAIGFCHIQAMPLVDSLSKSYEASIRRVSDKVRNPLDKPNELEKELLDAYKFQVNNGLTPSANVQPLDGEKYLFTKPIMVDNALCLTCHGKPDNGMLQATDDFIKSKYPEDEATGYEIGDLRGMWSITIPKKRVILSM